MLNDRSEIELIIRKLEEANRRPSNVPEFRDGISVVIPSYQSSETIGKTIDSLAKQTLSYEKFEVIVILNGPEDGSGEIAREVALQNGGFQLRIVNNLEAGAGAARNVGMSLVNYSHITFVDADDWVEPRFLEEAFEQADGLKIIASPIVNFDEQLGFDEMTTLNGRIRERLGTTVGVEQVPWLLGFNACKFIPTHLLIDCAYRTELDSGEDLVFFANLLKQESLEVTFIADPEDAAYVRRLKDNSVSRQTESFDFNVRQRVACMQALREIEVPECNLPARETLERAQASFVRKYLDNHSVERIDLVKLLAQTRFESFPWDWINAGKARDLAISYCFLPFSDTAAVVAAKAISEREKIVDVISADMRSVRNIDPSLNFLCAQWIENQFMLNCPVSFNNWSHLLEFAKQAVEIADKRQKSKGFLYETVYTRALWAGSHLAGILYKMQNPWVKWSAEFSDPLRFGVDGEKRTGRIVEDASYERICEVIESRYGADLQFETIFDLIEAASFLLADELIFTNENQLSYMLSKWPSDLANLANQKALVRPHPAPSSESYDAVPTDFEVTRGRCNIGYFGAFYHNRGLGDVFSAIVNMRQASREKIKLNVFTNSVKDVEQEIDRLGLSGEVSVQGYLPYLEFLNVAKKMDVLLVNDVKSGAGLEINPFLPSKYSDYRNSGAKIWGIIEEGSALSRMDMSYESSVGNVPEIISTLNKIGDDWAENQ